MNDQAYFYRLVAALTPWNHQLVFIGGWAHRLYRLHPGAGVPIYEPVATLDADVAFGNRDKLDGDIKARLADAGFKEQLRGNHVPPVTKYTIGDDEDSGFYAEFLTPLIGRERTSDGRPLATLKKAGVTAQRLRYLELLLASPWEVTLPHEWGEALKLRIPNPVSYMVQKLLIFDKRQKDKRPQDILYIHDTIDLFGEAIDALVSLWQEHVRQTLHKNWQAALGEAIADVFGAPNDWVRNAAAIPQDRKLDPERMRQRCLAALKEILD